MRQCFYLLLQYFTLFYDTFKNYKNYNPLFSMKQSKDVISFFVALRTNKLYKLLN